VATAQPDSLSLHARSAGERFATTPLFAILSRAGFVARALIYGIIGLLAFELVVGHVGKITNQQGALRTVEQRSFGQLLLALLAVGLGGYALWRLFRAFLGHGREGADTDIVLGLVAVFLLMAAYDHEANEAIGLDAALAKLDNGAYGSWLLGAVVAGLIAFACFSFVERAAGAAREPGT
jgi:uncharacterized protein DUF1206